MRLLAPVLLVLLALFSMAAAAPDPVIEKSLKARLQRSKMKSDGLTFLVKDGVVEWNGEVAIPQRKGAATRMAKAAGAVRVVNRIRVKGGTAGAPAQSGLRVVQVVR